MTVHVELLLPEELHDPVREGVLGTSSDEFMPVPFVVQEPQDGRSIAVCKVVNNLVGPDCALCGFIMAKHALLEIGQSVNILYRQAYYTYPTGANRI